jgi:hypothetical protein
MAQYTLLDGVERNRRNPRTFHIPTELEKCLVEPGDFVKLGFDCPGYDITERMWVKVAGPNVGHLNNDPAFLPLKCDMVVHFHNDHILGIMKKDDF